MIEKIRKYCVAIKQPVPESVGQIARCVYESLALKYRWALERLEEIKGARIGTLNIVGGGSANALLCQLAADAAGRPVIAGPAEGACAGNLLMQAAALGELSGIGDCGRSCAVRLNRRNMPRIRRRVCRTHTAGCWDIWAWRYRYDRTVALGSARGTKRA